MSVCSRVVGSAGELECKCDGNSSCFVCFFSFCQTWVTPPPARLDAEGVKEKKSLQVPVCPPPTIAAFNIPPVALRAS